MGKLEEPIDLVLEGKERYALFSKVEGLICKEEESWKLVDIWS